MEVGWDFVQKQGDYQDKSVKHWAFRNNYYFKQELVMHPDLHLDTLYNGELFLELSKFRFNIFWETIWFTAQNKACLQFGWTSDPITFLSRAGFNMAECSKMLIKTFTDWSQWDFNKMRTNGFFDACRSSVSTTTQIYKYDLYQYTQDTDNMWTVPIEFDNASPP